ncbi:MAG: hypothetical protein RL660_2488 [Bacteroidota bacterium]|jgi:hypothetical protein
MEKKFIPLFLIVAVLVVLYFRSEQVRINGIYTIAKLVETKKAKSGQAKIYEFIVGQEKYHTTYTSYGNSDSFIVCQFLLSNPNANRPVTDVVVPVCSNPLTLIGRQWNKIAAIPLTCK